MSDLHVIEELQSYLVAQAVCQLPSAAASMTVPSVWLHPRKGFPQPRDGEQTTISLVDTLQSQPVGQNWEEEAFVDIIVRSTSASACKLTHRTIRGLVTPIDQPFAKQLWMMNNLLVEYSTPWRGEQPLPIVRSQDAGNNLVTYDRVASYRFGCRRKSLAGTPYVP